MEKSRLITDGNNMHISMDFAKVNQEKRTVSGFATLDNPDTSDDIVLASASRDAFSKFRNNLRLMHTPTPIGRVLSFVEKAYYDEQTKELYNGIWVEAYISKGAPDAWEMVVDGTLTGFSIGGNVVKSEVALKKDRRGVDAPIRLITEYELNELSLVDNPANQLANVVSVIKSAGNETATGIAADVKAENVFWCLDDKLLESSTDETMTCADCDTAMQNIGWFEKDDSVDKSVQVRDILNKFLEGGKNEVSDTTTVIEKTATDELGTEPVEVEEVAADDDSAVVADEVVADDATEDETPSDEVENEDETPDNELEKSITKLAERVDNFENKVNDIDKANTELKGAVDEIHGLVKSISENLVTKVKEISDEVEKLNSLNGDFTKRVDGLESSTAFKKSADRGDDAANQTKDTESLWGGTFFDSRSL